MKFLILAATVLISFNNLAQRKWDIGIKVEQNNRTWAQLETRFHLNDKFSLAAKISGNASNKSYFDLYGFDLNDSVFYYQNNNTASRSAKLDLGAQYYLPLKRKTVYVGINLGGGYEIERSRFNYFNSLSNLENSLVDPGQSYGYSLLTAAPIDRKGTNEQFFASSDLMLGIDLPIREKLMFTSAVSTGVEYRSNFIQLTISASVGLRYRFIKKS
ncbi:MAG: hypothetical protein ACJA0U_000903 [Salibacteraceae bacterium]|jgi:hypothetical protein